MTEELKNKLIKLKTLAERGSPGEKDNAAALLKKLCFKYGVSINQIDSLDHSEIRWFRHKRNKFSERLLLQCMYKTLGSGPTKYTHRSIGGKAKTEIGVKCTAAEAIEIELDYSFFTACFDTESERLYDMFVQKNDIFPKNGEVEPASETAKLTKEDIAMYQALQKHTRALQITGGAP